MTVGTLTVSTLDLIPTYPLQYRCCVVHILALQQPCKITGHFLQNVRDGRRTGVTGNCCSRSRLALLTATRDPDRCGNPSLLTATRNLDRQQQFSKVSSMPSTPIQLFQQGLNSNSHSALRTATRDWQQSSYSHCQRGSRQVETKIHIFSLPHVVQKGRNSNPALLTATSS